MTEYGNQNTEITDAAPLLECRGVTKSFAVKRATLPVLTGVCFSVQAGEVLVITGRSGAGKSTLLNLLGGLERPTAGSIVFAGRPLETLSAEALAQLRREQIGIIFQNFNLLPTWTTFENVEAALLHTRLTPAERREQVLALLRELGLDERLDNRPAELSAGQQQRVAIARTLAHSPRLILADEPTGDVDPETAAEILARLLAAVRQGGATLIVATHGSFPLDQADRILRLQDGVVREAPAAC
ncbi:MAG TPA: ABC transporter ATP-binding protein [Armatimonadota bacterium]